MPETPWQRGRDTEAAYRDMFAMIPDGLTFLSLHFNAPGDFEAIEPEYAHIRTEEYALFKTRLIRDWVDQHGLTIIGLRAMRERLRSNWASRARSSGAQVS